MDTLDNLNGIMKNGLDGFTVKDGELQLDKAISTATRTGTGTGAGTSSFKTCEEYVLASLEAYKKKAALVDSYAATLSTLKEIFFVVSTPTGINIGVHDERLDIEHDPTAIARVMLLKTLFETTATTTTTQDQDEEKSKGDLEQYKEYTTESAEEAEALNIAEAYKDALYNEEGAELDLDREGEGTQDTTADISPAPKTLQEEEEEEEELNLDGGALDGGAATENKDVVITKK